MAQFKKMLPPKTRVIRDGKEDIVAAEDIVLGDICKVVGGVKFFYYKFLFQN